MKISTLGVVLAALLMIGTASAMAAGPDCDKGPLAYKGISAPNHQARHDAHCYYDPTKYVHLNHTGWCGKKAAICI